MRNCTLATGLLIALGVLLLMAVGGDVRGGEDPDRDFFRTYYLPPVAPRQQRLYGRIIRFLDETQHLPESVRLKSTAPGFPEDVELDEEDAKMTSPVPGWKAVAVGRTEAAEKRAYALLQAGRWADARAAYRTLVRRNPDNTHLRVMLALCEARCQNRAEARRFLEQCTDTNQTLEPWLQWMEQTEGLFGGEETQ